MTEPQQPQPVTLVTRNGNSTWKLAGELAMTALALYYVSHPDMFDRMKEWGIDQCKRTINTFRIWDTRSEIRTLPETDVDE